MGHAMDPHCRIVLGYLSMKTTILVILAFVIGGLLTGTIMNWGQAVRDAQSTVRAHSDVYDPMRTALQDIVETHDQGDHELAEAKTRLLTSKWATFVNGGPPPEQFAPLVETMTTTRPTTQLAD